MAKKKPEQVFLGDVLREAEDIITGRAALRQEIEARIAAAIAAEREACAKVAEAEMRELFGDADEYKQGWNAALETAAAAIRARGKA